MRFFQRNEVYYCFDGNYIASKRVAFRLLALAVPDPVKMEIKIAYPERDIMECTLVVIVFSVNAGKVINTRREVVEAVSLMGLRSPRHQEDSPPVNSPPRVISPPPNRHQ